MAIIIIEGIPHFQTYPIGASPHLAQILGHRIGNGIDSMGVHHASGMDWIARSHPDATRRSWNNWTKSGCSRLSTVDSLSPSPQKVRLSTFVALFFLRVSSMRAESKLGVSANRLECNSSCGMQYCSGNLASISSM